MSKLTQQQRAKIALELYKITVKMSHDYQESYKILLTEDEQTIMTIQYRYFGSSHANRLMPLINKWGLHWTVNRVGIDLLKLRIYEDR